MEDDREWMYEGRIVNGMFSNEWGDKVDEFVAFALRHPECEWWHSYKVSLHFS